MKYPRKNNPVLYLILLSLATISCKTPGAGFFDLPSPSDTSSRDISFQDKKEYRLNGITADNLFDGARLNGFEMVNDSVFRAIISPENSPINASSYYSFRLSSVTPRKIYLEIYYTEHEHRYVPKLSLDGTRWWPMHKNDFDTLKAPNIATLRLSLDNNPLWISAQELKNSSHVRQWVDQVSKHEAVHFKSIGKSKLGRDLLFLDIWTKTPENKDAIVIISRQHPPEVTGYMAMESFVEELLDHNILSKSFLETHRILVFPLMNPDGVDLGHWRHNAGGIDLNRDWAYYRQEETRQVTNYIANAIDKAKNTCVLGLDFHSTQSDLYYTFDENMMSIVPRYKDYWLAGIDQAFSSYTPDDQPNGLESPISKAWFYLQFGAESVTYEIGDETPRGFVREKARRAAQEMMKLLIFRK